MTFHYTHSNTDVDSSVVFEAYYNAQNSTLAVVLDSGWAYTYLDVPKSLFDDIDEGRRSVGRLYALSIKGQYKSGEHLGHVGFENEEEFVLVEAKAPVSVGTVGTPKALNYAAGVTISSSGINTFSLSSDASEPKADVRRHEVKFTTAGGNNLRSYTVKVESVDAAVEALNEVAEMLGVDLTIKEVTTYFE